MRDEVQSVLSPSPAKGLLVSITVGKFHNVRVKKCSLV